MQALPPLPESDRDEGEEASLSSASPVEVGRNARADSAVSGWPLPLFTATGGCWPSEGASEVEGRVAALKADLASKRSTAQRLESEYKRRSTAHLRQTEQSLAKQISVPCPSLPSLRA